MGGQADGMIAVIAVKTDEDFRLSYIAAVDKLGLAFDPV